MPRTLSMLPFLLLATQSAVADAAPAGKAGERQAAVFAGGCFWCTEADFEKLPGVISAVSGYTGGHLPNPTYERVTRDDTGHYEAVRIVYDPKRIGYAQLLRHYFRTVDPLDPSGQFCDRGSSYRTAIFVRNGAERALAEAEKARVAALLGKRIVTPVLAAATFYPAEKYHQDYYKRNPVRYKFYRYSCGRDARLKAVWNGR